MSDRMSEMPDLEAPERGRLRAVAAGRRRPRRSRRSQVLSDDLEVPEPDAIEQHQPAPVYDEEDWR